MDTQVSVSQEIVRIPLTALRGTSKRNVRKGGTPIKQLARSIQRVGLLQNLTVTSAGEGDYEVEAGKRRLLALQLLVKKHLLPETYEVPCLVVPGEQARTASLTENTQRAAMHPADEFEAFKALVDDGKAIEDIAADFGVTPLTVQRRLRLANVSPRLLADYRKGLVTLEQLMALAVTDDHKAQEAAFYEVPEWQREPRSLREHLTVEDVEAARDPVARFVGTDVYEEAGGTSRRDLFADEGQGIYLSDRALLDRLAADRLAEVVATVQEEGWAWVEVVPRAAPADLYAFQRIQPRRRKPTDKESRQIAKLQKRMGQIEQAMQAEDGVSGSEAETLSQEHDSFAAELEAVRESLALYPERAKATAGVVVTVDNWGRAVVHRGLVREADVKQAQAGDGGHKGEDRPRKKAKPEGSQSDALTRQLSTHRTAALQAELARQPAVALVAVVHKLALRTFYGERHVGSVVQISSTPPERLERYAPDLPATPAVAALTEAKQGWRDRLPAEAGDLFAAVRELPQDDLLSLLAVCAAGCIDAVTADEADDRAAPLALALELDMAQWWTPTAAGYFGQVPKGKIVEAIKSFSPDDAHQLEVMKKGELAAMAERLAAGKNWLPPMLRRPA